MLRNHIKEEGIGWAYSMHGQDDRCIEDSY